MDALIGTLADLVRINSVNPAYPDGAPESAMAAYIQDFFEKRGVAVSQQCVFPGRPNVVATLPAAIHPGASSSKLIPIPRGSRHDDPAVRTSPRGRQTIWTRRMRHQSGCGGHDACGRVAGGGSHSAAVRSYLRGNGR